MISKVISFYYMIIPISLLKLTTPIIFLEESNPRNCSEIINNLDIICTEFIIRGNKTGICEKWEARNFSAFVSIPNRCYDKKYNLDLYVKKKSNTSKKLNLNFYLEPNNINYKISEGNNFKKEKKQIKKCAHFFNLYEKKCSIDEENKKKRKICDEWLANYKISKFCYYVIIDIINNFENNIINIIKNITEGTKGLNINNTFNVYLENLKYENIENIIKIAFDKNKKQKKYFDEPRYHYEDEDYADIDRLEIYFIKSRKDCVEYGLKSLNEDFIICTKYE